MTVKMISNFYVFDYSKELKCSELLTSYSKRYITTILIKDPVLTLSVDQFSTKQTSVQPKKLISLLRIHEKSVVFLILTHRCGNQSSIFLIFTQPTPAHMITFLANTAIHVFCIQ